MADRSTAPMDPRVKETFRTLFGDRGEELLALAAQRQQQQAAAAPRTPGDPGKFIRELAALYCETSQRGQESRDRVRRIIDEAMHVVNLLRADDSESPT